MFKMWRTYKMKLKNIKDVAWYYKTDLVFKAAGIMIENYGNVYKHGSSYTKTMSYQLNKFHAEMLLFKAKLIKTIFKL